MDNSTQNKGKMQVKPSGNTWLVLRFKSDITAELGNSIPFPQYYYISGKEFVYGWLIDGFFWTNNNIKYLNDIIARFKITFPDCSHEKTKYTTEYGNISPLKLKQFQGLKSKANEVIKEFKHRRYVHSDSTFWCLKLYAEELIRQDGLIIYQRLEKFALENFSKHKKGWSTVRMKIVSIFKWYCDRDWKIGRENNSSKTGEEIMANRVEHAIKLSARNEEMAKQKVYNAQRLIKYFNEQDGKLSLRAIERQSGCSINTVRKHFIQWDKI